jgi:hypothetical protein
MGLGSVNWVYKGPSWGDYYASSDLHSSATTLLSKTPLEILIVNAISLGCYLAH